MKTPEYSPENLQKIQSLTKGCRLIVDDNLNKFLYKLVKGSWVTLPARLNVYINVHKGYSEIQVASTYLSAKYPQEAYLDLDPDMYEILEAFYKLSGDMYETLVQAIMYGKVSIK